MPKCWAYLTVEFGIMVTYNDVTYNKTTAGQTWIIFIIGMMWCNVGNAIVFSYFGLECGRKWQGKHSEEMCWKNIWEQLLHDYMDNC